MADEVGFLVEGFGILVIFVFSFFCVYDYVLF